MRVQRKKNMEKKLICVWLLITALCGVPGVAISSDLESIISARDSNDRVRDIYRHPVATLTFFEVQPGMTTIEVLPGGGWYTRILVPYIGKNGRFFGANYTDELFKKMMGDRWESSRDWVENWPETFPSWAASFAEFPPDIGIFHITKAPEELYGEVDRILFIRCLHHLNRFNPQVLDDAAAEAFALLKPGGIVGVVQHRAPESNSEEWSNGSNGYLRQTRVIEAFVSAGFSFVDSSEINANPKDKPTEIDRVWRLPPALRAEGDAKERNIEIGESDRMTLKFKRIN